MDIMEDHGLSQHVTCPTRGNNTLDLLLTNRPKSTIQSQVIRGMSHHDVPLVEIDIDQTTEECEEAQGLSLTSSLPHGMSSETTPPL